MIMLCLVMLCLGCLTFAAEKSDGGERRGDENRRIFADPENDPVFQALAALTDAKLQDEIEEAMEAFFSSRFTEASSRVTAIMEKHSESTIGNTLYNFLLLMNGTALGFSGKCKQAVETLDELIARIGEGDDAEAIDNLAGVMDLKIDVLEENGDSVAALAEIDRLIDRFGDSPLPSVQWRVKRAMQRKTLLLKESGNNEK